ncbi:hypothetical protein BDQ17DRAFT_235945 [Cyathus striatus]|nr:hypothetical protein BDQ17DRAFT_235945 [Cyathus striatus]
MSLLIRKIKAIQAFRRKPTRPLQEKDWLQIAITAVKLVKSTGDFAPFPFVNSAANVVLVLLESLKAVYINREDFQALTEDIVHIITRIRDHAISQSYDGEILAQECRKFTDILQNLKIDMESTINMESGFMSQVMLSEQTKGLIARYRQILSSELQISLLETTLQILATVKKPHRQSDVEMQVPELANYKQIKMGDIHRLSKISREQEKQGEYYSEKSSQPDFEEYIVEVAGFEGRRRVARYYNNNALDVLSFLSRSLGGN